MTLCWACTTYYEMVTYYGIAINMYNVANNKVITGIKHLLK